MHTSSSARRTNRCLRNALRAALFASAVAGPAIHAQPAQPAKRFHIAAGSLKRALNQFTTQSGLQILYDPSLLKGDKVASYDRTAPARAALETLLKGTGLIYQFTDGNTVVIKSDPPQTETNVSSPQPQPRVQQRQDPPPPPQDPQESPAELGKVTVTGTRIKRTDVVTSQPVVNISNEDIKNSGLPSIGQVLQNLTSTTGTQNASFNFESNGASNFDLRFLGSKRVLVLVNGQRFVTGLSGAADLNEIPTAIVDHIEILQDGASAIYGSDAISGVVNIITKKNFHGVEATAYRGIWNGDGHWDGLTQKYSATVGGSSDRAGFTLTGSYEQQNGIPAPNRQFSQTIVPGTGVTRGSSATPQGRFEFIPPSEGDISNPSNPPAASTGLTATQCPTSNFGSTSQPEYLPFCDLTVKEGTAGKRPSDFKPFTPQDRYNYVRGDTISIPIEKTNVYMQAHYNFLPSLKFHTSILYNNRNSNTPAAPTAVFTPPLTIPANQRFNPFGFKLSTSEPVQVAPGVKRPNLSLLSRRLVEFPPRKFTNDVITTQFEGGFNGYFNIADRTFNWNTSYSFASNKLTHTLAPQKFADRTQTAVGDPAACAAAPGCTPLNLFGGQGPDGTGTITPAQVNYIAFTGRSLTHTFLRVADVNLNSSDIFDLPYGPIGVAVGYEHREQSGSFSPSAPAAAGNRLNNRVATLPTNGNITVNSAYAELNVPILSHLPGAYGLNIDAATRYSDYDLFGSTDTSRVGLKWTPIRDLAIRATWSQGFRAPNINEAFGGQSQAGVTTSDPCTNYTQSGVSAAVQARCKAAGVSSSYTQGFSQINTLEGGNENLKPETSISRTLGFVYSPDAVPGLSINADYYQIDLENSIQPFGTQNVINSCYLAGNQNFCSDIIRNELGSVKLIKNLETNIGGTRTKGVDFGGRYKIPSTAFGNFTVHLKSSYVNSYEQFFPNGRGGRTTNQLVGRERGNFTFPLSVPRWKANAGVNWDYGNFSANVNAHFISGLTEKCTDFLDNTSLSLTNLGLCSNPDRENNASSTNHLAAVSWYDAQISYKTPYHFTVSLGANNLFDRKPPRETRTIEDLAFDPTEYQLLIGRFIYGRITARF